MNTERCSDATIVLVGSDPINHQVLKDVLHGIGTVEGASSGDEALARLGRLPLPALVVVDVTASGMDGFAFCEALKAHPVSGRVPLMLITAANDSPSEVRGVDIGAVDCIQTPINRVIARARVAAYVELSQHRALLERMAERRHGDLARLASELSLAEERERRRIAAELHDGAVQNLGLLRIKTGLLSVRVRDDAVVAELEELKAIIDKCNREMRSLICELSPPMLYELGLEPAVEWLVERFESDHGFRCRLQVTGHISDLDTPLAVMMFQTIRELLMNAVKHARPTEVTVDLEGSDGVLTVRVKDDGVGVDVKRLHMAPSQSGGFGLFNMRERLSLVGGTVELAGDNGTQITLRVPMTASECKDYR